ncbi:unnamed protein product [Caenorhabditis angaria]|uniref:Spermine synthase n=1 Tax=Caenorhabditis angaria TaxID=860376 RepID=A0A9P1IT47_9PELO|nr:unnamed protein product [Caenorhabditis angaria]
MVKLHLSKFLTIFIVLTIVLILIAICNQDDAPVHVKPPEHIWELAKMANFGGKDGTRVLQKFGEKEEVFVVDVLQNDVIFRAVLLNKKFIGDFIGNAALKPPIFNGSLPTAIWELDHGRILPGTLHESQLIQIYKSGILPFSKSFEGNALVFGVGTGAVFMYLQYHFTEMTITGVKLSKEKIAVAEKWFDFSPTRGNNLYVQDIAEFLNDEKEENNKYDMIIADVGIGFDCPPDSLITEEFLKNLRKNMKPTGVISINLLRLGVPNLLQKYEEIRNKFAKYFESCEIFKINSLTNAILTCFCSKKLEKSRDPTNFLRSIGIKTKF